MAIVCTNCHAVRRPGDVKPPLARRGRGVWSVESPTKEAGEGLGQGSMDPQVIFWCRLCRNVPRTGRGVALRDGRLSKASELSQCSDRVCRLLPLLPP